MYYENGKQCCIHKGKGCCFCSYLLCVDGRNNRGDRPGRNHSQEARNHRAWIDSLVQWVKTSHQIYLTAVECIKNRLKNESLPLFCLFILKEIRYWMGVFFISLHFLYPVGDGLVQPEALNKKAIQIINRVRDKLTGESSSSPVQCTRCPSGEKVGFFMGDFFRRWQKSIVFSCVTSQKS